MALSNVGGDLGPLLFSPLTVAVIVVVFVVVAQPLLSVCVASDLIFGLDDDYLPS